MAQMSDARDSVANRGMKDALPFRTATRSSTGLTVGSSAEAALQDERDLMAASRVEKSARLSDFDVRTYFSARGLHSMQGA